MGLQYCMLSVSTRLRNGLTLRLRLRCRLTFNTHDEHNTADADDCDNEDGEDDEHKDPGGD